MGVAQVGGMHTRVVERDWRQHAWRVLSFTVKGKKEEGSYLEGEVGVKTVCVSCLSWENLRHVCMPMGVIQWKGKGGENCWSNRYY